MQLDYVEIDSETLRHLSWVLNNTVKWFELHGPAAPERRALGIPDIYYSLLQACKRLNQPSRDDIPAWLLDRMPGYVPWGTPPPLDPNQPILRHIDLGD